jgi:hypothetical protein
MIEKLLISNFKSIKDLEIDAKRVNVFIGKPNTGKSNILEAMGLLSWCGHYREELKEFVRFLNIHDLFHDNLIDEPIKVTINETNDITLNATLSFRDDEFQFWISGTKLGQEVKKEQFATFNYKGEGRSISGSAGSMYKFLKFYRFKSLGAFHDHAFSFLSPPHGTNMFHIVRGNKKLRETMSGFFAEYDLTLVLKAAEDTFELQQKSGDIVFSYPYLMTSETLQRMIFYTIAMESNNNVTLIFEEPEAHAFPYYVKWFGERIGMDTSNQYFIATHNPYLIGALMDKTPSKDLNVLVTYRKEDQTKVISLTSDQISEIMTWDPFFNLSQFIPEEN